MHKIFAKYRGLLRLNQWRALVWPIRSHELKKFLPLLLLSFLFTFIYTVLRNIIDALLMAGTAGNGAETLPFLSILTIFPIIIFALFYTKLSNYFTKEKLFTLSILPFIIFFLVFGIFLYPNLDVLTSNNKSLTLGFTGLVTSIKYWPFTIFYIVEEIWASFAMSVLFWGVANNITRLDEAKRFYVLFGLGANLGTLCTGPVIKLLLHLSKNHQNFETSILYLMVLCAILGVLIIFLHKWIIKYVISDTCFFNFEEQKKFNEEKTTLSFVESMKFLSRSKAVLCIAILVVAYQIIISNSELIWKDKLRIAFPDPGSYLNFMSSYSMILAIVSSFTMLFISNNILRIWGWVISASITPLLMLITSLIFFGFIILENITSPLFTNFGFSILSMTIAMGAIQNLASKTSKYSLFDPTKEMAYIPLDQESKVKGKAIVDSVGSRFGKLIGSLLQILLISLMGSLRYAIIPIAISMILIFIVWFWAIRQLKIYLVKKEVDSNSDNTIKDISDVGSIGNINSIGTIPASLQLKIVKNIPVGSSPNDALAQ